MSWALASKDSARYFIIESEIFGQPMHVAFTGERDVFYNRAHICWLVAGSHTTYGSKDREPSRAFANVFGTHGRNAPKKKVGECCAWRGCVACVVSCACNKLNHVVSRYLKRSSIENVMTPAEFTQGDEDEHGVKLELKMFVSNIAALNCVVSVSCRCDVLITARNNDAPNDVNCT